MIAEWYRLDVYKVVFCKKCNIEIATKADKAQCPKCNTVYELHEENKKQDTKTGDDDIRKDSRDTNRPYTSPAH